MIKRTKQAALAVTAIAALALGGSALAGAASNNTVTGSAKPAAPAQRAATEPTSGPDRDNVQSGDQTTPDTPSGQASAKADGPANEMGTAGASNEAPESASESGSEKPGDDGPGGHADEPGNPSADHQFEGQE